MELHERHIAHRHQGGFDTEMRVDVCGRGLRSRLAARVQHAKRVRVLVEQKCARRKRRNT